MSHYFYCEQRSDEWYRLRLGVATASEFYRILTPTGKLSKSDVSRSFMYKLIAQRMIQRDEDAMVMPTKAMEWGIMNEQAAVDYYELMTGADTKKVGFILADNGLLGASPDRLVGDDGLLEIKCPTAGVHVGYLDAGEIERSYWPQVQGQLYVSGREWSDWMSYHPEIRPIIVRTSRDEEYLKRLSEALDEFCLDYLACLKTLVDRGYTSKDVLRFMEGEKNDRPRYVDYK